MGCGLIVSQIRTDITFITIRVLVTAIVCYTVLVFAFYVGKNYAILVQKKPFKLHHW